MSKKDSDLGDVDFDSSFVIAIHCGAGIHSSNKFKQYRKVMRKAVKSAQITFAKTQNLLSSLVSAIVIMENSELINAGFGSNLNCDGIVECDASILNVNTQKWAAMSGLQRVINPIGAVECLYNQSLKPLSNGRIPPMFIGGSSADDWSVEQKIPIYDQSSNGHSTETTQKQWRKYSNIVSHSTNKAMDATSHFESKCEPPPPKRRRLNDNPQNAVNSDDGTCAAIAFHRKTGQMFVGVSSGGMWLKRSGRIGPSSIIGSGIDGIASQSNIIGCATSGNGEYLMQLRLANQLCQSLSKCDSETDDNCGLEKALKYGLQCTNNQLIGGGLVLKCVWDDNDSKYLCQLYWIHNSQTMAIGYGCGDTIKTNISRLSHFESDRNILTFNHNNTANRDSNDSPIMVSSVIL